MKKMFWILCLAMLAGVGMSPMMADEVEESPHYYGGKFPKGGSWLLDARTGEMKVNAEYVPDGKYVYVHKGEAGFPVDEYNPYGYDTYAMPTSSSWRSLTPLIRKIVFSSRLKKIGWYAFAGCFALESVEFEGENEANGAHAIKEIGKGAFMHCWNLKHFEFNKVYRFEDLAFSHTGFTSVEFSSIGISVIHDKIFANCRGLIRQINPSDPYMAPSIYGFGDTPSAISGFKGFGIVVGENECVPVLANDNTISNWEHRFGADESLVFLEGGKMKPNEVTGQQAFWYVNDDDYLIIQGASQENSSPIPWRECKHYYDVQRVYFYGTTAIPAYAFPNDKFTRLERVCLTGTESVIGEAAFKDLDKLEQINLWNVSYISSSAFKGCESLKEVNMYGAVTIGRSAFSGCSNLEKVT